MKILKSFKLVLIFLIIFLITVYLLMPKTISIENIPFEEPTDIARLNKAISISKFNLDYGIIELENLNDLHDYTNYKKNYILARLYEKRNDINKAISLYEKLRTKNYPLKDRVIFHLAQLNTIQEKDIEAKNLLNELISLMPDSRTIPQAKYLLAQTLLRLRFTEEALNILDSLKSKFSETQFGIAANYYLGEHAYNNKKFDEAINYWRQYLEKSPDGRFATEISNIFESNKTLILNPYDYSLLGNVYFNKKDYKKAAHFYKLNSNKKDYYQLGYSLFRTNNHNEATKYLKEFAYNFPRSKDAKWSLYYTSICTPSYLRRQFWKQISKDISQLAYYSTYKEAAVETDHWKREKLFLEYIKKYPDTDFTLEAVWGILWQNILDRNYFKANEIGAKYFELSSNTKQKRSDTWAKIGFWLGKIAELSYKEEKAIEYYKKVLNDPITDNYYTFRAQERINALSDKKDSQWKLYDRPNEIKTLTWSIPTVISQETLKKDYGATFFELINLKQYDEAIEIVGASKSLSEEVNSWLQALNGEYDTSIKTASVLISENNIRASNNLWKLAYPLHYWEIILNISNEYKEIDPFFICGIIRQESHFDPKALSVSNAHGLMQLIPPTAKTVARQINLKLNSTDSLNDPKTNIQLGIHYITNLVREFNNPLFAVSSYNAGPNATKRWISSYNTKDLDFFIEQIPYEQTRTYVKKVFAGYWTYLQLYKPTSF